MRRRRAIGGSAPFSMPSTRSTSVGAARWNFLPLHNGSRRATRTVLISPASPAQAALPNDDCGTDDASAYGAYLATGLVRGGKGDSHLLVLATSVRLRT
ncbi:uncharacterized protein TrAtP1_000261 [Trichoderma atroviride]|uniref:uncharacterized protein n=1 Tax=Hypocrea atroviridis TaxID=63577 RepID=UPI00331E1076|nr:hypothetical protein TrAtP1_000261 [Trichoderma atroviride]